MVPAPPPHPGRSRNPLNTQSSMPLFSCPGQWEHTDIPPPLPPRSMSQTTSFSTHQDVTSPYPPDYSPQDPLQGQGNGKIINSHVYFPTPYNFNVSSNKKMIFLLLYQFDFRVVTLWLTKHELEFLWSVFLSILPKFSHLNAWMWEDILRWHMFHKDSVNFRKLWQTLRSILMLWLFIVRCAFCQ